MSPEQIIDDYNNAAQVLNTYVANEAAKIGNSQRSLGTLASRVGSPSGQTSGLANYTYNRTLRPVVDSLTTNLITTGKAQALENKLAAELRAAKNNYENSKNNYTSSAGSGTGTPTIDPSKKKEGGVISTSPVTKKEGTGKDAQQQSQQSTGFNWGAVGSGALGAGLTAMTGPIGLVLSIIAQKKYNDAMNGNQ